MFLLYAAPGAWVPLFSLHLTELTFTPLQIGWASATYAFAALATPLLAGQLADRYFPAQRCLAAFALVGGGLLWLLAELTGPVAVFWVCLGLWLVMVPAITLTASICFAHLADPGRTYGSVRLWGTVGWVVPGLLLGWWFSDPAWFAGFLVWVRPQAPRGELADALRLGALLSFALAGYALTLPHTPPARPAADRSWLAPLAALRLLRRRPLAVYCACSFGVCVAIPFNSQVTPLLLEQQLRIDRGWLSPTLTLAQSMEIVTLGLLPWLLLRLGVRGTMALGLLAWVALLTVLAVGGPPGLVVAALGLNGVCVCCFLVAGQVFVNGRADREVRCSSQALLAFVNGAGLLAGHLLVGWVREQAGGSFGPTFTTGAVVAGATLLVFLLGFTESGAARDEALAPQTDDPPTSTLPHSWEEVREEEAPAALVSAQKMT
jgi:MFS family permease